MPTANKDQLAIKETNESLLGKNKVPKVFAKKTNTIKS